ncbi:MAG: 2-hydroxyacid dehydrogenase [Hyphomicrobiales bacterium]
MSIALILSQDRIAEWSASLQAAKPDLKVHREGDNIEDIDYAFVWLPPPSKLAQFPNLKIIFSLGAGVDHVFNDPHLPDVPIVRVVDENLTKRMSEWVVMNVLMHHRQLNRYVEFQAGKVWRELDQCSADEVRVGILGIGAIGQDSAVRLRDLGFQVAGWSNSRKAIEGIESFAGRDELERFLNRTDILVNLLPHTPDTHHIMDMNFFKMLARDGALDGPFVINGGRGGTQVEADIAKALHEGVLHGASLDVFEKEPLPADSVLWDAPNLYIYPHVAAVSQHNRISQYVVEQIERFERGDALQNIVDPDRGY